MVQVLGGVAVAVGADVVGGAVVVGGGAGAVVVGGGAGAVVVAAGAGAVVVVVGAGAVVVVAVGAVVGVLVPPLLATVKSPRRLEVVPLAHLSTTRMRCDPSASLVVSYGSAVPSAAVPARSKGAALSVRTGVFVRHELSR